MSRVLVGYDECRCILTQYCDGECRPVFADRSSRYGVAPTQGADVRPVASDAVLAAVERMCMPLDESRLSGVTAQEDARCIALVRDYVLATHDAAPRVDAPIEFPYQRTFDAIAAATWMARTSHIHISVRKFQETYNAASGTPEKTS